MNIYANVVLGWTPILAVVADGSREVLEVTGWTGGSGTAPATGVYVGATGYVSNIALAVDIKGSSGSGGGVNIVVGTNTISSGDVNFSNANGVTFGLTGSTMTASVRTDYQSSGNYLTTAMQSNAGSNFINTSAGLNLTNISATLNSNSISLSVGNYLTTAMASNASLNNLADVVISSPAAGQNLQYDGTNWINVGAGGAGGAAGAVMFFDSDPSGISTYETIQQTPSSNPQEDEFVTVNNNTVFLAGYSTPTALGRTVIDSGVWDFNIFGYATVGSTLVFEIYKRTSGGAETLLFTAESDEITNSVVALLNFSSVQPAFTVNSTDYLVVKVYGKTTNSVNIDVHFVYSGVTNYSHIHTPIAVLHNDLEGLQGGSANEYYHLNAAEYGFRNTAATSIYQQTSAMSAYLTNVKVSAGTLSALRSDLSFINSNGVTFGLNTNGEISASVAAAGGAQTAISGISAGTTVLTSGTLSFGNSNGVSFGLNGSVLTATVKTDYLTTAAKSNQVVNSLNGSTGQISLATGSSLSSSQNGSTITFGLASNITTALQSAGNYLTTAAQSNQVVNSLNGSTGQVSLNVGSSLSASTNGSSITFGLASNITTALQSAGAYLTTAMASDAGSRFVNTSAGLNLTNISATLNSNSISLSVGNYITTARASTDAIGLNTAQTNVTWTVNSSGLSINAAGYAGTGTSATNASVTLNSNGLAISVAAPGGGGAVNFSAGTTSNNLQSVVFGNNALVSFGLGTGASSQSITASHNGITSQSNQNISLFALGNTTQNSSTVLNASNLSFNALGELSVGFSNGSINFSANVDAISAYAVSNTTQSSSGTLNVGSLSFAGAGNISVGVTNGSVVISGSDGGGGAAPRNFYNPYGDLVMVAGQVGQGTLNFNPNVFPAITFDRVYMPINNTNSSNSSGSHTLSFWLGIYTSNGSSLSLLTSQSSTTAITHSGTAGSYSLYSGMRHFSMPMSTSFSEGRYYVGIISRTTSAGANGSYSQFLVSNLNSNFLGQFGVAQNTTMQFQPGLGVYSATTSAFPSSVAFSQIRGSDSAAQRPPILIFANSTF